MNRQWGIGPLYLREEGQYDIFLDDDQNRENIHIGGKRELVELRDLINEALREMG